MNKITTITRRTTPEVGQYWQHKNGDIYLLCVFRVGIIYYHLVNIRTGATWSNSCEVIEKVFSDGREDFHRYIGTITIETTE